jgi:hypothetical protein
MKSLFLFLFLSISFCATAEDPIIVKGHPLEKKYFKLLDYTDAAKRSDSLKLEAHLSRKAGQIVSFFENNPLYVPTSKESTKNQLGMVLAYSALFLMNTNNGFIDGVISYEEIVSNQKVSLTDVPKDEIIARMKARLPAIEQLKNAGVVGENNIGYLQVRDDSADTKNAVDTENNDRKQVYAAIAAKNGTSVELVGKRRAIKIAKEAGKDQWLQNDKGEWYQKK